jgi:hypothetical protein
MTFILPVYYYLEILNIKTIYINKSITLIRSSLIHLYLIGFKNKEYPEKCKIFNTL